jgi:hypothetical protein
MKLLFVLITTIIIAGCDARQATESAFRSYLMNCKNDTFTTELTQEGKFKKFVSTCEVKKVNN